VTEKCENEGREEERVTYFATRAAFATGPCVAGWGLERKMKERQRKKDVIKRWLLFCFLRRGNVIDFSARRFRWSPEIT
jgi:hypothetical protein